MLSSGRILAVDITAVATQSVPKAVMTNIYDWKRAFDVYMSTNPVTEMTTQIQ